jgi:hypothetical protein
VHTIAPATSTTDYDVSWTDLTQNTIATYNGGATAGAACPITRQVYVQQVDNTWLLATDADGGSGVPSSFGSKTPKLDWFIDYSSTSSTNTLIAASNAFSVSASYNSVYASDLFVQAQGRTYNIKMVSFDPNSMTSKN